MLWIKPTTENPQVTQYDLVFPNQEKEGLSVFEVTFFYSLENKHFPLSYAWGGDRERE